MALRSVAEDVANFLAANNHGSLGRQVNGTSIGFAREFETAGPLLLVFDTGSFEDLLTDSADPIESPTFQLFMRGDDYAAMWAALHSAIRGLTNADRPVIIGSNAHYVGFWLVSGPFSIGVDEKERHRLTANMRCYRSAS